MQPPVHDGYLAGAFSTGTSRLDPFSSLVDQANARRNKPGRPGGATTTDEAIDLEGDAEISASDVASAPNQSDAQKRKESPVPAGEVESSKKGKHSQSEEEKVSIRHNQHIFTPMQTRT